MFTFYKKIPFIIYVFNKKENYTKKLITVILKKRNMDNCY